jgi:hypothetical protein
MSIFEHLEAQAAEENLPFKNAAVVAIDRCERRFGSFVMSAKGEKEFDARIDLVRSEVAKIAQAVCEEHGYDDPQHIAALALGQLDVLAARNSDSADTDSVGNAERQKLDTQDPAGYYTEPSPKLNPGSSGDNMKNTNPAIPELTPDDKQHPDDFEWPWDSPLPAANLVDAGKPMQPENHVGDNTMTFPNVNQAKPVTSHNIREAADSLNFHSISELMTPSEVIKELVGSGMPKHEAEDKVWTYVNHINPGWSQKTWTSAVEGEDEELGALMGDLFDGDAEEEVEMDPATDEFGFDAIAETPVDEPLNDELLDPSMPEDDAGMDDTMLDDMMESGPKIGKVVFDSFMNKINDK